MCLTECLQSLFGTRVAENAVTNISSDDSDNEASSHETPRAKLESRVTGLFSNAIFHASQIGVAGCVVYFSKKIYDSYNDSYSLSGLWNAATSGANPYVKCQLLSPFSKDIKGSIYEQGQVTAAGQVVAAVGCGLTSLFYLTCAAKDVLCCCCTTKSKIGTVTKLTAGAAYAASAFMLADCAIKNIAHCS